jgi:hypothetical protein
MNVFIIDTIELDKFVIIISASYTEVVRVVEDFVKKMRADEELYTQEDMLKYIRKEFKGYVVTAMPIDNIFNIYL